MKKQLTLLVLLVCTATFAQKTKIEQGNFDFITDQKEVNVAFVYENMTLLKEKMSNEEYIAKRSGDLEEKARGEGKAWKKKWNSAPELIWNPKFLELINKYTRKDTSLYFEEGLADTKYTLIVETVWLDPGWDVFVMRRPAKVTTSLRFVETANKENVLAQVSCKNAPGDQWGNNFSNESRVGEGYAKTAKSLAKMIVKKAF